MVYHPHLRDTDTQFSSVQSLSCVWLFVIPWTAARQASLSITNSWSLLKLMSIKSVIPSNHLILCHPLLLPPSIFPSIRVLSNESVLHIKGLSFSFSISPSNEYSGLISFKTDWLDLLAVQGSLKSLLQHHSSKASILRCSAFFIDTDTAIDICSFCMPSLPPPLLLTSAAPFPLRDTSCHITFDFDEALIKGYCSSRHYLLYRYHLLKLKESRRRKASEILCLLEIWIKENFQAVGTEGTPTVSDAQIPGVTQLLKPPFLPLPSEQILFTLNLITISFCHLQLKHSATSL